MKGNIRKTLLCITLCFCLQPVIAEESFVLDSSQENYKPYKAKLPRGTSILKFEATLAMPISESMLPKLTLYFPYEKGINLFEVTVSDALCTGEYDAEVGYLPTESAIGAIYFDKKTPWPETFSVELTANLKTEAGFKHTLIINEEVKTMVTFSKLKRFYLDLQGRVDIENYKIMRVGK